MHVTERHYRLRGTARVIQEVITIVMAMAFTYSVGSFLTANSSCGTVVRHVRDISLESWLAFVSVVLAIVRFFHGNINYLRQIYDLPDAAAVPRKLNIRLAIDFLFILAQALIFCALALYQPRADHFYPLFAILFLVDAAWFFTIHQFTKGTRQSGSSGGDSIPVVPWMVTNFFTALVFLGAFLLCRGVIPTTFLFCVIMLNTAIDYRMNWPLYFPSFQRVKRGSTAFVAARFTTAIKAGKFDPTLRAMIERIYDVLRDEGVTPVSAHIKEEFGKRIRQSEDFIEQDRDDIRDAEFVVALVDEQPSPGMLTELGWASEMHKPTIILVPERVDIKSTMPHIRGLHTVSDPAQVIIETYENGDKIEGVLREAVKRFVKGGSGYTTKGS